MNKNLMDELVYGKTKKKPKKQARTSRMKSLDLGAAMNLKGPNLNGMFPKQMKPIGVMAIKKSTTKQANSVNPRLMEMFPGGKKSKPMNMSGFGMIMTRSKKPTPKTGMSASTIIGDRKTRSQNSYLKKHKGVMRFADFDKDGVPNGLDCKWKDPTKHGITDRWRNYKAGKGFKSDVQLASKESMEAENKIVTSRKEYKRKAKEALDATVKLDNAEVKAKSFKDEAERIEKERQQFEENKLEARAKYEKERKDVSNIAQKIGLDPFVSDEGKLDYGKFKKFKEYMRTPLYDESGKRIAKEPKLREEWAQFGKAQKNYYRAKAEFKVPKKEQVKQARAEYEQAESKSKKQYADTIGKYEEKFKTKEQFKESLNIEAEAREKEQAARDRDKLTAKAKLMKDRLKSNVADIAKEQGFFRSTTEEKEVTPWQYAEALAQGKNVRIDNETTKFYAEGMDKKLSLSRPLSKKTGYLFESPEERKRMKDEDMRIKAQQTFADLQQLPSGKGSAGLSETKRKQLLDQVRKGIITRKQSDQILSRWKAEKVRTDKLAKIRQGEELEKIKETKARRAEYQSTAPIRKEQERMMTLDAQRKQEASRYSLEKARYERGQLAKQIELEKRQKQSMGMSFLSGNGSYQQSRIGSVLEDQGFTRRREYQPQQYQPEGYQPRYQIPQHSSKTFNPEAPKFIYRPKAGAFTRKTQRVVSGEQLTTNQESMPSQKIQEGSMFPWTKPMMGWERVYVGKGQSTGRGRSKRAKKTPMQTEYRKNIAAKVKKNKFIPYVKTYRHEVYKKAK